MVLYPIIAVFGSAGATILEKITLKRKNVTIEKYQALVFSAIAILLIPLLFFFHELNSSFFTPLNLGIFLLIIIFSILANHFTFYSMKWAKLGKIESAKMTELLFVSVIAFIFGFFLPEYYEGNYKVLIAATIAGGTLILTHTKKHHLKFSKYYLAAIAGSFFFALEMVISKILLEGVMSPTTLYFLRCTMIVFISFILLKPKLDKKFDRKTQWEILLTGAGWVLVRLMIYYGYIEIGVQRTSLILMLGPVLIYFLARKILKNKLTWRNYISAAVILLCITYVIIFT